MNAVHGPGVFARSLATRRAHLATSSALGDALRVLRAADYDLIFVETAGIGQSDSEVVDWVDLSLYVMTPEFGAPSQLEKIDMIELADLPSCINKFGPPARGRGRSARRTQAVAARAPRGTPGARDEAPVYPTIAQPLE